jgi:hypothetical protein
MTLRYVLDSSTCQMVKENSGCPVSILWSSLMCSDTMYCGSELKKFTSEVHHGSKLLCVVGFSARTLLLNMLRLSQTSLGWHTHCCCCTCIAGRTLPQQALCNISCATTPCAVASNGDYSGRYITAPGPNSYLDNSGVQQNLVIPIKCACTDCLGKDCEFRFWVPPESAASCPLPKIGRETFYKPICRSNATGTNYGWTGWVDEDASPVNCTGYTFDTPEYSVWCPEGK